MADQAAEAPATEVQDVLDELVHMQAVADKAGEKMRIAEHEFRGAKKEHDKLIEQVQRAVREAGAGKPATLFEPGRPPVKLDDAKLKAAKAKMTAAANGVAQPGLGDAWKATPVEKLGLPPKIVEALKAHQPGGKSAHLDTLGGLCEFAANDKRYSDIPGIAKGGVQKIEDAIQAFFQANPLPAEPAKAEVVPAAGETTVLDKVVDAVINTATEPKKKSKKKA